ncbi:phosphoglycerate mutase [Diaporthe helianthi]|uniref:Phosphoglycerate mutase n=1 Tax=Diaporthe helianthi TaxID=158607 RepID=A0A2P5HJL7_DIAHE|nr:phosphoglycerate mutase [Diaporthe helianthi]
MSLEVIYVTRHGFRSNWLVDASGNYSSYLKSPTGIATDPALTSHGVEQAHELAAHLMTLDPPVERVYSSPYYRCLQTVEPFIRSWAQSARSDAANKPAILGEAGLSEWYGSASFEHPTSASSHKLAELFPAFDTTYSSAVVPSRNGESIVQLHDRVALTMDALIRRCDDAGVRAVLLCSHAATIIALGRVLTGNMPENVEAEDFRAFTCGLSVFRRRLAARCDRDTAGESPAASALGVCAPTPQFPASPDKYGKNLADPSSAQVGWKDGRGVGGGWHCEVNGDCSFLSAGEERGWRFSGDESFANPAQNGSQQDAGVELGVVVEGKSRKPRL